MEKTDTIYNPRRNINIIYAQARIMPQTIFKYLEYFVQRLSVILWHSDLLLTRFIVGVASFIFGINIFQGHEYQYIILQSIAPMKMWGYAFLALGIGTFVMLLIDHKHYWSLIAGRIIGSLLWSSMSLAVYIAGGMHPLITANISLALASWWILARTAK